MPIDVLNFLIYLKEDYIPSEVSGKKTLSHPTLSTIIDDPNTKDSKTEKSSIKPLSRVQIPHIATGMTIMHALTGNHAHYHGDDFDDKEIEKHIRSGYLPDTPESRSTVRHILAAQKYFSSKRDGASIPPIIGRNSEFEVTLHHPSRNGDDLIVRRLKDNHTVKIDLATHNARKSSLATSDVSSVSGMHGFEHIFDDDEEKFKIGDTHFGTMGPKTNLDPEQLAKYKQQYIDTIQKEHGDDLVMTDAGHVFEVRPGTFQHKNKFIPLAQLATGVRTQNRPGRARFQMVTGKSSWAKATQDRPDYHKEHLDLNNPESIRLFFTNIKRKKKNDR